MSGETPAPTGYRNCKVLTPDIHGSQPEAELGMMEGATLCVKCQQPFYLHLERSTLNAN